MIKLAEIQYSLNKKLYLHKTNIFVTFLYFIIYVTQKKKVLSSINRIMSIDI